jgi:hypothetical protein
MSIRYDFRKTGMFPLITCDVCGIVIDNAQAAIVVWNEKGDVAFAHKGQCGLKAKFPYWDQLDIFLASLSNNAGCGLKQLRAAYKGHDFGCSIGFGATERGIRK